MSKPTIHLICNAHLDPVWQWRWEEGCAEALSTFRNAVQMLHEHDQLLFNHNEAILYRWVQQYDPALFAEIQRLVHRRRWTISGGWFLQPDANLPDTEGIFRHIAEGRRFFREHFQVEPKVAYNFDSFGHAGGIPQILKACGYEMYIHMRPQAHELTLPSDLYWWQGVDGSQILAYRIAVGLYHTERDNIEQRIAEGTELALKLQRDVPVFWGIGNHGGGATREDLERIDACMKRESRVAIIHSTTEKLLEALRGAAAHTPVVEGDLQRCFTGTYTSLSRIKRRAQESLAQLLQMEALRTASWWMHNQEYPSEDIETIWRDHLFNDFHDILPGSCTHPAEHDALDQYGKASESMRRLRLGAVAGFNVGSRVHTYVPVSVVNTNPAMLTIPVEVECMLDLRPKWSGTWHLTLHDLQGREIPCQEEQPESLLPFNGWRRKISYMATLPSVGITHYDVRIAAGDPPSHSPQSDRVLQGAFDGGSITTLQSDDHIQCLRGPLFEPLVIDDDGDSWGTDHWKYRNVVGRFTCPSGSRILHSGPVRTITESVFHYHHSRVAIQCITYPQWPVIEYRFRAVWNEVRRRLVLAVPTRLTTGSLVCGIPGGANARPQDGDEHVHGRWCIMQGQVDGRDLALGIANTGQHGISSQDGEIRLSVLRSAAYCHEQGLPLGDVVERKFMDLGVHDFRLAVTLGSCDQVRTMMPGLSEWLLAPPVAFAHLPIGAFTEPIRNATENRTADLLTLSTPKVRLLACKRSWDGEALILRCQETTGGEIDASLWVAPHRKNIALHFRPLEIKTIRVERSGDWRLVTPIDER